MTAEFDYDEDDISETTPEEQAELDRPDQTEGATAHVGLGVMFVSDLPEGEHNEEVE